MTSGVGAGAGGTNRVPAWALAYTIIVVATVAIGTVNVLSALDQYSWMDRPLEWWEPVVWEASSGVALLALAWAPMLAIRRFCFSADSRVRDLAVHVGLTVAFSLVHVSLMVGLRHLAYAIADGTYEFGSAWLYEYRKDVITYTLYAGTYWLSARLVGSSPQGELCTDGSKSILIDEGQRVLRVPPRDVLAVRSSGNYVEFLLADGRRPLMRSTLTSLGAELGKMGFVRTHRSWLVNVHRVVQIEAEGSGDYGLTLDQGTQVPLSRRYRVALEMLRGTA